MIRSIARFFFRFRSYLPIPGIALLILLARPTASTLLVGVGIASLGEGIRIWALRHAGPKTRSHRKIRCDDLVVTGPYSIVRNPLYIGNFIISLGVCGASGRPILIAPLLIIFALYYHLIIRAEEEFLEGKLGIPYREYRESTPRILPSLGHYSPGDRRFPFREILPRELNTITAIEAVLALVGLRLLLPG